MRIGNVIIRSARSVRRKLEDNYIVRKTNTAQFYSLFGAYQSRICGLCVYRTGASDQQAMLKLHKWFQEDLARADVLIKKHKDCFNITEEDRKEFANLIAGNAIVVP